MKTLTFLILSVLCLSQQTSFQLWVEGSNGISDIKHEMGFNSDATINHDVELEVLIPPFDPPADSLAISSIVFFDENHEGDIWTRNHLQPYPDSDQYYYEYNIRVYRRDITFSIKWDGLRDIADSAFIEDQSGLGIYTANPMNEDKLVVDNENVQNISFTLKVWYNLNKLSIENNLVDIFPNPCTEYINIDGFYNFKYKIYDLFGNVIDNGLSLNNTINVSKINSGQYIIEIQHGKSVLFDKFIKH